MDFGTPARTMPAAGTPVVTRSDVTSSRDSVAVELPPERTVQSAGAGDAVRVDVGAQQRDAKARSDAEQRSQSTRFFNNQADRNHDDSVERRIVIDPQTRAVVLQKRDAATGETVSQLPDETLLKLRAYSRELAERAREDDDETHARVERTA